MPRVSVRDQLHRHLRDYLAIAEAHPPAEMSLDVRSVAAVLHVSPTTLYKYRFNEEINAAERRQRGKTHLSGSEIDQLKTELEKERERNRQFVGRIAVIEANAGRLGIDPEELYRAVLKPVRSLSRAGSNMSGARKRFRPF